MFTGFILAFLLDFTGLELHQWIGIFAGILGGYHLISHWNWVTMVTQRFFGKTTGKARFYYLMDASILTGFFAITFTGLAMSSWFSLALSNAAAWQAAHVLASIVTLSLIVIKIGLHWRWVVWVVKKMFAKPTAPIGNTLLAVPAPSRGQMSRRQMSRREFLQVMGLVSVASTFALSRAVESLSSASTEQSGDIKQSQISSSLTSNLTTSSQSCSILCQRRCSYPGRCKRYIDTNDNNMCDNGECT